MTHWKCERRVVGRATPAARLERWSGQQISVGRAKQGVLPSLSPFLVVYSAWERPLLSAAPQAGRRNRNRRHSRHRSRHHRTGRPL